MLQLAVAGIPYFRISDMEIRRKGYKVILLVTLEELKKAHPDTDYYFIMGADSFFRLRHGMNRRSLWQIVSYWRL